MSGRARYAIRPLTESEADGRAQVRFLAEACPDNPGARDPLRSAWLYRDHPARVGPLPLWVLDDGERILGQLGAIPVTVKLGAKSCAAAWCVDFVVAPEFRNRGVAALLLREVATHFDLLMALGTTELSSTLFRKAGWADLGTVPHFVRLLDARAVLARLLPKPLAAVLAPAATALLRARPRGKRPARAGVVVSPLERFGPECEDLWGRVAPKYACLVRRDPAYLSWKYVVQPRMRYTAFRADAGRRLRGYAVVRMTLDAFTLYGVIADLLADPEDADTLDALLGAALVHLRRAGASFARCYAAEPRVQAALARAGFVGRASSIRFMLSRPPGRAGFDGAERLSDWFLMKGDSDLDRIPLPEDA